MLELKHVSKKYQTNGKVVDVIKDLSFEIEDATFVAFVGPTGCGKTTLLKVIAGLVEPTSGEILMNGNEVIGPGADRGMIFQDFTLFPWLTVKDNIGFGLDIRGVNETEKNKKIEHYLKTTGLTDFADFYPKDLSGGMQQRVAIARTLANDPKILLMDEPFAALDAHTRSQMQDFLTSLWENEKKTVVFVTHDVSEAAFLADKICVLSKIPMKIKKVFDVPFPRRRLHELKHDPNFFTFCSKIAKELEE